MRRLFVLGIAALLPHLPLFAQLPVPPRAETPVKPGEFSAEPYVVRRLLSHTVMHPDGTGLREQTLEVQLQSDAAVHLFSVLSINYARESARAEFIYARVRRPDGTLVDTPVSSPQVQPLPVTREAPAYSDLVSAELPLRGLHVGDTLEWQTRVTETRPDVPGQFYGQDTFLKGVVVLEETHQLDVPAARQVTVWTNPRAGSKPSETVANGMRTYTWRHTDLAPTVGAAADAHKAAEEKRMVTPEEELDSTRGALPSIAWTTFPDWAAVGAWYRDLVAGQAAPNDAIRAKVTELTAGKSTPGEKAEAVYYFVSSQIRYVAVSFGVGRYKPHTAAEVFSNQYGDCKDKHTLLAAMLAVLGIPADPVLAGVGVRFNEAVPSPESFNHLITRAAVNGQAVWLDTTNEVAPWRALFAGVRDLQVLVIPPSAAATVQRTPADLPYAATVDVTVTGSLNDKLASESDMTYVFHDDTELALRLALRNVPSSSYGEMVQRLMGSFGFGGTTSEASFQHLGDASQPLHMQFHYHRDKEDSWGTNRVTVPFAPQFLPYFTADKPPTGSIQLDGPRTLTTRVEETLPPGWTATLPDAEHEDTAFAKSSTSYRLQGTKLVAERRLTVLQSKLPATDAKAYREWFERASAGDVPYLQLQPPEKSTIPLTDADRPKLQRTPNARVPVFAKAPGAATANAGPPDIGPSDAAAASEQLHPATAAELLQQAHPLLGSGDMAEARELLERAKAQDPKAEGLWMGYAALDARAGNGDAAAGDLRLELQYHPEELRAYNYLAMQQMRNGDTAGATATLRECVRQFPLDRDAALYLVGHLERVHQAQQAYDEAQRALARLKNSGEDLGPLETAVARLAKEVPDSSVPAH